MRAATCTTHPGIRLNPGCYKCGPKEEPMQEESTIQLPVSRFSERLQAAVMDTIAFDLPATPPVQPTLSATLFPPVRRADVPMVKISISGTIELTQEQYQAYLDGSTLGPGAVVDVRASGYVVQPGAAWTKRKDDNGVPMWEKEGRIKIKLVDLGALAPTGEEWSEA